MSDRYESKQDLADKVEWEGGFTEAIFGYGISADELPEDTPTEIVEAWKRLDAAQSDINLIEDYLGEQV